ncbi:hypothetical protein MFIFM68171_11240 [Madurella fahalii]|uniref:Uncharacterized protein n=1 Tax=Madurella fahalii TaxID=1157608 RepID=A0ABQ0GTH0_9PEZI
MSQQTEASSYDPAVDTVFFDINATLSAIELGNFLCDGCRRAMSRLVRKAFGRRLDGEPGLVAPSPSQIRRISRDPDRVLQFFSTLAPRAVPFASCAQLKAFLRPDWDANLVDATVAALSEPGDDAWNLAQCKLWHALKGRYTVQDAVRGRSLAEFMRSHMTLLNALLAEQWHAGEDGDEGGDEEGWRTCERWAVSLGGVGRSPCFPELPYGYPHGGEVAGQARQAVASGLRYLDRGVAEIVRLALMEHRTRRARGAPEPAVAHEDEISVLAALEQTPAFKARLRALERTDRYRMLKWECTSMLSAWRSGAARAVEDPDAPCPPGVDFYLPCDEDEATFDRPRATQMTRDALNLIVNLLTGGV